MELELESEMELELESELELELESEMELELLLVIDMVEEAVVVVDPVVDSGRVILPVNTLVCK